MGDTFGMDLLFGWLSFFCVIAGAAILALLSWIDLKTWLLPNKWVLPFAILGFAFHGFMKFSLLPAHELIFGALLGSGILYVIRMAGNAYYKQDTLGLGDVKLLGAAGFWLGLEGVVIAMTAGAFAGVLHGIGFAFWKSAKDKQPLNLKKLMIPAGPGFCAGIVVAWLWQFYGYWN